MIPKIIHYCWFGGKPLSREAEGYIQTWRKYCPDYAFRRWDETNFDFRSHAYVREAYEAKRWAFVTDYVRLWALDRVGGIYLDTDVEVCRSLDRFLIHPAFAGFENEGMISTAVMGSEPHGAWVEMLLKDYDGRHFLRPDGRFDLTTNVSIVTASTRREYAVTTDNTFQAVEGILALYPTDCFCPKSYETGRIRRTENTCAIHHFAASWHTEQEERERRRALLCKKLLGRTVGTKAANALNAVMRRDGSFSQGVRWYLRQGAGKLFRLLPIRDTVVFESEGDFCDNARALYEYMLAEGLEQEHRIVWFVSAPEAFKARERAHVRFLSRKSLAGIYHTATARLFFFTHPWWLKNWRRGQTVVDLSHSAFTVKGAEQDLHGVFDYICSASLNTEPIMSAYLNLRPGQMVVTGFPRQDLVYRKKDIGPLLADIGAGRAGGKMILCMPTFRQSERRTDGTFRNEFSINPVHTRAQLEALDRRLREMDAILLVKIHHLQRLDLLTRVDLSNIFYLTDDVLLTHDIQLNELLGRADALLTDFSSVLYDYLPLDRMVGFFTEDLDQYTRGFTVADPLSYMPGPHIRDMEGLYAFLGDVAAGRDEYHEPRKALLCWLDDFRDDRNCLRVAQRFGLQRTGGERE